MKNTGTSTWTQAGGYALVSQNPTNNTVWGTNRLLIPSSASVAPGASIELFNTLTAPATPGTVAMQWRMSHNGTLFGDPSASLNIIVSSNTDNAQFISQKQILVVAPGAGFNMNVLMKNTGTSTWTQAGGYCALTQDPSNNKTWGTNRLLVPSSASVTPGSQITCSNALIAPVTPGMYALQFRMYHNGVLFGDPTPIQMVNVGQPGDASFISQVIPTTVVAGSHFTAKVTMQNTGTTTWTQATGFCMQSENPFNNAVWGTNRLLIPSSATVAPGNSVTLLNTLTAPSTPGTYSMSWIMSQNGVVFGPQTPNVMITVTAS